MILLRPRSTSGIPKIRLISNIACICIEEKEATLISPMLECVLQYRAVTSRLFEIESALCFYE